MTNLPLVHVEQFGVKDVEVIQVVRTTLTRYGEGTEQDPIRRVTQFWSLDGDLLAEVDPERQKQRDLEKARRP